MYISPLAHRTKLLILFGMCAHLAYADPTALDRDQLLRSARDDGAVAALAWICKQPDNDVRTFISMQKAKALALAKKNSIEFDDKTYLDEAQAGNVAADNLINQTFKTMPNRALHKKYCSDVRAKLRKQLSDFDLHLSDSEGPNGHAYAFTPWKIVTSKQKPYGMAMVEDSQVLAMGTANAEGFVVLDAEQQKIIAKVFCRNPSQTWFMSPGQTLGLGAANEDPAWTQYVNMKTHRQRRLKNCVVK